MLLQVLGGSEDFAASDDWHRFGLLLDTLSARDFRRNACIDLLRNVFAEDDLRVLDARPVRAVCDCSTEKASAALKTLGRRDALAAIDEQGWAPAGDLRVLWGPADIRSRRRGRPVRWATRHAQSQRTALNRPYPPRPGIRGIRCRVKPCKLALVSVRPAW